MKRSKKEVNKLTMTIKDNRCIKNTSGVVAYPETDWQLFKQYMNVWFDFAEYRELPFRFARSKLALNIAGLINEGRADMKDLRGFSKKLQIHVCALLGDTNTLEEITGIRYGGEDSDE